MEPSTIPIYKDEVLPLGQDYAALRTEGLARLQALSGGVWTDYNDHDPGVTLLEALCFVLTDVSRRAALPIPTLLAAPPGRPAPDALEPPHRAFANFPVTLDDFRKLVLDQFYATVRNIWLSQVKNLPGHYEVAIELLAPPSGEADWTARDEEQLRDDVLDFLNLHRNLGEVFVRPVVLRPRKVAVGGQVELNAGQVPEQVLAELLSILNQELDPFPQSGTAAQLLNAGLAPEDVFAGPYAHFRLVVAGSLAARPRYLDAGGLLRRAGQVAGGRLLGALRLYSPPDGPAATPGLEVKVGDTEVAVLDPEASLSRFTVNQNGVPLAFDPKRALRAYARLVRENLPGAHSWHKPEFLRMPELTTAYADLGRYDSVQRLLPPLYGVGDEGPPLRADATARAQVMQLKGYLLLFDQLLTDFCAQVANVRTYFAPTRSTPYTDFHHGLLYDVPFVAPLLPGTGVSPDDAWNNAPAAEARWQQYQGRSDNPYRLALPGLNGTSADAMAHRSGFLTHLLARFGYTVRLYQDGRAGSAINAVRAQEQLLAHMSAAAYHRAAARLPTPPDTAAGAESGLEFFLFLLAELESMPRKWAKKQFIRDLEDQVYLGGPAWTETRARLVVRGGAGHFARLLDALASPELVQELVPVSATAARFVPDPARPAEQWELELVNEPTRPGAGAGPAERIAAYVQKLNAQVERFSLIDHLVLKPYDELSKPAPTDEAARAATDFYHCQATVLLPGYAFRFRLSADGAGPAAGSRAFVEDLIRQHAPAHLLVNILWLDYPAMREWERLYGVLADVSGLLNASGRPELVTLGAAQRQVRLFLEERLPRLA